MAATATVPETVTVESLGVGDVIELPYGLGIKVVARIDRGYGEHWRSPGPLWALHYTDGQGNAFAPSAPIALLAKVADA